MSTEDLAWAAGLLEGEGCFTQGAVGSGSNRFRQLVIACAMTDRDVLERLQGILGGNIETKPRLDKRYSNPKPLYRWYMTKRADVEPILIALQPLMGVRRAARIQELLDYSAANPPRYNNPEHGTRNMYRRGCKCNECRKAVADYARNHRAAKKAQNQN